MKMIITIMMTVILSLFLSSCAQNLSPCTYNACEIAYPKRVFTGVIVSKRCVRIDASTGIGGFAGVTTGAIAGSGIGGSAAGHLLGGVGGAIVGGLVGNALDKAINCHRGYEYIIRLKDGELMSVVQPCNLIFVPGQRVLVLCGYRTRIIPDNGGC